MDGVYVSLENTLILHRFSFIKYFTETCSLMKPIDTLFWTPNGVSSTQKPLSTTIWEDLDFLDLCVTEAFRITALYNYCTLCINETCICCKSIRVQCRLLLHRRLVPMKLICVISLRFQLGGSQATLITGFNYKTKYITWNENLNLMLRFILNFLQVAKYSITIGLSINNCKTKNANQFT